MKIPAAKKLPSGSWRVQVSINGQRMSIVAPTKREAEREAAALKSGAKVAKSAQHKTLSDAITDYIESKSAVLSPATIRGYRAVQKTRFAGLMDRDVSTITKKDVQQAVNAEIKLASAKTVSNAYGVIRPVLKACGVDVFGVHLPQVTKPVKKYLQPEDIGKLVEAVVGDTCEIPILLAVWLGMRRSEIIGLCWDCIDTTNNIIHIRRTVVPDDHHQWVLKNTAKNQTSQRSIDCPEYIMDKIKQLPRNEDGRLFHVHPDTVRRHTHRACAAAGITDTTIHGLRHTNAAVMKTLGIDDRFAMERGGWSCENTYRKTYSYVFDSKKAEANASINDFFSQQIGGRENK